MEIGYFTMPSHPPECGLKEGHDWDLQTLRWLDELGYQEAWIGEHHTAPWEPHPSPDLLLAQASATMSALPEATISSACFASVIRPTAMVGRPVASRIACANGTW